MTPERYTLKIDFRKYFHGGVIPERFKCSWRETTTTKDWEEKTPDEIFSDIQTMREKIESIRPAPVAYAGKKAFAAMKKSTMYDPTILQIEESDALPDNAVFIPAKSTIIEYTGE